MAYAASKAALNMMTQSLSLVLGPEIRINAIAPGAIQTRWLQAGMTPEQYQAFLVNAAAFVPLQVVPTPPVGWSEHFVTRHAGQPFKNVVLRFANSAGAVFERKGECVATATGVEGSLVYAASALLRDEIIRHGHAVLHLDLLPDWPAERVAREVAHPRGSRSISSHLKSRLGLDALKTAVLYEVLGKAGMADVARLAPAIKALPLHLVAARPIDEAISSAGGVLFEALDAGLMCEDLPGVFCAGEMLDWEAPTGGYLLTACLASGRRAGQGVRDWLATH